MAYRGFSKVSMNWIKGPIAFSISFTAYDIIKTFMMEEVSKFNSDNTESSMNYSTRRDSNIPKNIIVADSNISSK